VKVKIWGTRGSIPTPGIDTIIYGGNTTCLTLLLDDDMCNSIIIDAGTGIRKLGRELAICKEPLKLNLIFTHSHWDHIQGFPFFVPAYDPQNSIDIYGCPVEGGVVKNSILSQMDTKNFPISFVELKAKIIFHPLCSEFSFKGARVSTIKLNHPGSGLGLKFIQNDKTFVFLTDHELSHKSYSGANFQETLEFCREADLLIHDAQFLKSELSAHQGWGHSAIEDVFEMAQEAKVNKLALFHHDPDRTDNDIEVIIGGLRRQIAERKLHLTCFAAQEGMEIEI
jgi:phosphoribosyl 1,2-cyclic phosphodiesterase